MKLDVAEFVGIAGEVDIRSVPTLLAVKYGQFVAAKSCAQSAAALAAFEDNAGGRTATLPSQTTARNLGLSA
jgi:thioredoxin-like negative regulator of GroEL